MKIPGGSLQYLYKSVFFILILPLWGIRLHAQVDTEELSKNQAPVSFINYEGPHARIETRAQIRNIGYALGVNVNAGSSRSGGEGRYFVIHSVSAPEEGKLDTDIFGLGIDVGVDHIRNLRSIIQGYLEGAYNYSAKDAALLAEYITIYNAVYRGNWNYFSSRFKTPALRYLSPEKAGMSIRFDEWPGRALLLIPLSSGKAGSLSAVNTTSLADKRVTEELRKEDDKGIDQRQEMVTLKERESDEAEQTAALQREAIRDEENRIAQERTELADERRQIDREQEQTREDAAAGRITQEDAQKKEEELNRRETTAEEKAEELEKREEALTEKREEAEKTEQFAEQKSEEARQEREEIAVDQQAIINQEESQPSVAGTIAMHIAGPGSSRGGIVRINSASGEELKRSPLNTVIVRTVTFLGGKILAVAGENRNGGAIRLIEISGDTLEMVKQGEDDISENTLLWVNGGELYAINASGGSFYLARFDSNLARLARSSVTIHPFASVNFQGDLIVTQREDGSALLLKAGDLTEGK